MSSSIRGYRVSWELSAGIGQVKEKGVSEDTFELRIEKLKVFSAYEVRVGVFNDFGEGIWSQRYKWRTGEDSKYINCLTVCTVQRNNSSLYIMLDLSN